MVTDVTGKNSMHSVQYATYTTMQWIIAIHWQILHNTVILAKYKAKARHSTGSSIFH